MPPGASDAFYAVYTGLYGASWAAIYTSLASVAKRFIWPYTLFGACR